MAHSATGVEMRERQYFYALDAVRFFAAFSVALFHLGFWATIHGSTPARMLRELPEFQPIAGSAWFGWVGVEIFFVISGFVIANSAVGATPLRFLKSRVLRLYPALWVCATITFIALLLNHEEPFQTIFPRYFHTMVLLPNDTWWGWIDGVYWTLAIEISFYLVVLFALFTRGLLTLPRLAWVMTACSCVYLAIIYRAQHGIAAPAWMAIVNAHPYLIGSLLQLRHGCLFALGIWIWVAANDRMTPARWFALLAAIAGGAVEVSIRASEFITMPVNSGRTPLAPVILWLIAVVAIFFFTRPDTRFVPSTDLGKRVLRSLGLMTYPFYLLHDIVGAGIMRILLWMGANQWLVLIASLLLVGAASWMICMTLEPRIRSALKRAISATGSAAPLRSTD